MRALLGLAIIPALAVAQPKQPPTAAQVLANIEASYKKPQHLTARFTQTVTYALNGKTAKNIGMLYLSKPDKLRFDYVKNGAPEKHFIFDGKMLWTVEHENQMIRKLPAQGSDLPAAMKFFTHAGSLTTDFKVALAVGSKHATPGSTVLALTPKQPSAQYRELYLVVDPATWFVTKTVSINSSGDVNALEIAKPATTDIDAKRYQFDPKTLPIYKVETR